MWALWMYPSPTTTSVLPEAHWDLNVAQDPTGGTAVRHEATWAADVVSRCGPTGGTAVRHEATWAADVESRCLIFSLDTET